MQKPTGAGQRSAGEITSDSRWRRLHLRWAFRFIPCAVAAAGAFGFVFVYPFLDGNGRIHRFLVHHVLTKRIFTPRGVLFPVSAVMLRDMAAYGRVLGLLFASTIIFLRIRILPTHPASGQPKVEASKAARRPELLSKSNMESHCVSRTHAVTFAVLMMSMDKPARAEWLQGHQKQTLHCSELA